MFERPRLPHRDCLRELACRGSTPQAELIVTTSSVSGSSAMGECGGRGIPSFIMVSCAMFTKVWAAHINYLKLSCFLLYPLTVWRHMFTGCSQGGKVTFGNTLYTFKQGSHPISTTIQGDILKIKVSPGLNLKFCSCCML